jgi:glutathionyl-hydroquinone reductase
MADRLNLQTAFEEILGSRNVYFQSPASVKMQYDAIRYELGGKDIKRADNRLYKSMNRYDGVFITRDPDTTIPDTILNYFEMCSFGRPYTADNLHHYPFTLYY